MTTPQQTPTVLPELTSSFHQALELHQAGRLEEASEVYLRILKAYPNHFDSLHLLGVIYSQQSNHAEAVRQIDASFGAGLAIIECDRRTIQKAKIQALTAIIETRFASSRSCR